MATDRNVDERAPGVAIGARIGAALAVGAVLALGAIGARAEGVPRERLERRFRRGELLPYQGGIKRVFEVVGRPDLVLRISKPDHDLALEHAASAWLAKLGIPTPRIVARGTYREPGEQPRAADVLERFVVGSKDPRWSRLAPALFNERTLRDARLIEQKIREHELGFGDRELLIAADGRLALLDPHNVQKQGKAHAHDLRWIGNKRSQIERRLADNRAREREPGGGAAVRQRRRSRGPGAFLRSLARLLGW